eukprot:10813020-Alexandrium_andersonii.AAC.1
MPGQGRLRLWPLVLQEARPRSRDRRVPRAPCTRVHAKYSSGSSPAAKAVRAARMDAVAHVGHCAGARGPGPRPRHASALRLPMPLWAAQVGPALAGPLGRRPIL